MSDEPKCQASGDILGLRYRPCGKPATTTWVYTTLGYRIPVCEEHARELREKNTPKPNTVKP
jgi:hypothetical protein